MKAAESGPLTRILSSVDLEPGEQLIFEGHPSWRSIFGFYLKSLVLVIVAAAIAYLALDTGPAVGTAAGDDYDFQFAGVAKPHDVVDAVHRAQREGEPQPPG